MAQAPDPSRDGLPPVPRTPSGRIPQWMVDEALGVPTAPSPWRADAPPAGAPGINPPPRRGRHAVPDSTVPAQFRGHGSRRLGRRESPRGRRPWLSLLAIVVLAATIGGLTAWTMVSRAHDEAHPQPNMAPPNDFLGGWTPYRSGPPPGVGSHPTRLGEPAPLATTSDRFQFMSDTQHNGQFTAYDPCRAIHYVTNRAAAPAGTQQLVDAAIARVSEATGLVFVDDGVTSEQPSRDRPVYQPHRYGERWAPVLIAWTDPQVEPELAGDVVGLGGSMAVTMGSRTPVYVTGQVELDAPQLRTIMTQEGGPADVQAVIEHELGHLVGLDHVDDPTQLMFPRAIPGHTDFGAGDLTGLRRLGQGRCAPEL